jgi:F420-dependent methylenetetrahydromethanopterin dehydrogenase
MSKILTITEFKNKEYSNVYWDENTAEDFAIEFAKIKVQEALKQARKVLDVNTDGDYIDHPTSERIVDSYPLENIK